MERPKDNRIGNIQINVSSREFFTELVDQALTKRKVRVIPLVGAYLVDLLEVYMLTSNVGIQGTFAETLLRAQGAERKLRHELLKKLGDTSLYISGFFGDSLKRKVVDIDYYATMGGLAYSSLSKEVGDSDRASVYSHFGERFLDFVDVLTYISQNSGIQSNQDLLRLYDRYVLTGSKLAKEQLVENGLLNPVDPKKVAQ
jgi:hypothetical protein